MLRAFLALAACVCVIAGSSPGAAQPAAPTSAPPIETLDQLAARCVARVAQTDLRIVATPVARDFRITSHIFDHALALAPDDTTLLRLAIEAAENADDPARVATLTRKLVTLDPDDTVAQLRLVSASIRTQQNVDDRLAAYDRWLGDEGASVDASVRSRLALDAALLSRERGDATGFARRLGRAIELDATNKDAATLALAFYNQRVGEPVGSFELMLAVLAADPLDPDLHLAMARHLAQHGANKGSSRFYATLSVLLARLGRTAADDVSVDSDVVRWQIYGARTLVERYNQIIQEKRQAVRRQREQAEEDKRDPAEIPLPESVRFPMSSEWVRFLAAVSTDDEQLITNALDEIVETARQDSEILTDPERRSENIDDELATRLIAGLLLETTWARLVANKQLEAAEQGLDRLRAEGFVDPARLQNAEGLAKARRGDFDAAERLLSPQLETDSAAALALAIVRELQSKADPADAAARGRAVDAWAALALRERSRLPGAFASTRYEAVAGKPIALDAVASKLESLAAGVPGWLDTLISNPRRIQSLEVALVDSDVRALEPSQLRISLRNVSTIPLGVGPDGPINTRFLIAPNVQIGTDSVPTADLINVVSLERRLRLMPGQTFSAVVPADSAALSLVLEQLTARLGRVRYRVLQGFEPVSTTTYDSGPFSIAIECDPLRRDVLPRSNADLPGLLRTVEEGSPRDVCEALLVVRGRELPLIGLTPLTLEETRSFYDALAARLPRLPVSGQLTLLSLLPSPGQMKDITSIDEAARALPDPAARAFVIAFRTINADDPIFADAASRATPAMSDLADQLTSRLRTGMASYATYNPDTGTTVPGSSPAPASAGASTPPAEPPADK